MNIRPTLIGAIIGDMVGSFYSSKDADKIDFRNISDDIAATQDTLILAEIANICPFCSFSEYELHKTKVAVWMPYGRRNDPDYKFRRFSKGYTAWCRNLDKEEAKEECKYAGDPAILLRTIPIAFYYKTPELVLQKAELISSVTSSDIAEINSAKTIALAIHLAYTGMSKDAIVQELRKYFGGLCLSSFRLPYNPVEMSMKAFIDSTNFESALRNAISFSKGEFNLATITCALAAAYYNSIPEDIAYHVRTKMSYSIQRNEIEFFRKLRKCDFIKVSEPPEFCPLCGSPVVKIRYGYIPDLRFMYKSFYGLTPKPILEKDKDNERLSIIGGCVVYGNDPKWGCVGCEVKFNDIEQTYFDDLVKELQKLQK